MFRKIRMKGMNALLVLILITLYIEIEALHRRLKENILKCENSKVNIVLFDCLFANRVPAKKS